MPKAPHMPPRHRPAPAMVKAEAAQTEVAMREFIRKNPQLLIESVDKYYKAEEAKAAKTAKANAKKAEPREFKLENLPKADEALVQQIINDTRN